MKSNIKLMVYVYYKKVFCWDWIDLFWLNIILYGYICFLVCDCCNNWGLKLVIKLIYV